MDKMMNVMILIAVGLGAMQAGGNSILSYKVRDHVTSLSAYVHQTPTSIASRGLQRQYVYHLDATTTFRYLAFLQ
jgi:hypothetical protein